MSEVIHIDVDQGDLFALTAEGEIYLKKNAGYTLEKDWVKIRPIVFGPDPVPPAQ